VTIDRWVFYQKPLKSANIFYEKNQHVIAPLLWFYFQKKYLRFLFSSDRMTGCQLLVVATHPEWKGGYPWQ